MVVFRAVRQSPAYLYVKAYCLCALVSLFETTPVSSAISRVKGQLRRNGLGRRLGRGGPRLASPNNHGCSVASPGAIDLASCRLNTATTPSRVRRILSRWRNRAVDLAEIKSQLRRDDKDFTTYPELAWDAAVRCSSSLHPEEKQFIELRKQRISSRGFDSLHKFLQLPAGEIVDPRDVPLVALGGSGGGYRAMYGFTAFIAASKKSQLWDCITWTSGVSGSCWTLGAYYTIAGQDISRLTQHYLSVAKELVHPISISAMEIVVRSRKGAYFLLGPLVRKAQCSIIGLGIMDLYATLITTYQFLSRKPGARLSRATFQWSKVWTRSGINIGAEPMPILTAVRRAPSNSSGVKANRDSSISKGQPPMQSLSQHESELSKLNISCKSSREERPDISHFPGLYQWFEISPLEIGCAESQRYIPTWAWGRTFVSGKSIDRRPEQSLSLLLGQCTSAPASPLTSYISALLASFPKGTVMSRVLFAVNRFMSMKRWERLWGNPIRAGHDPNPFYGIGKDDAPQMDSQGSCISNSYHTGTSELDVSALSDIALLSKGNYLDRIAQRIFTAKEWEELNKLLAGMQDPAQRKTIIARYLSSVWAAKSAAYKALSRFYSLSWEHLVVSTSIHSPTSWLQPHFNSLNHPVEFSGRFREEMGISNLPRLHLNLSWSGDRVMAKVTAERRSFSTQSRTTANDDWNLSVYELRNKMKEQKVSPWEAQGRVRLMDSGMSNNLPNHVLARPGRGGDVILAFDASSDVQRNSAVQRLHNFAEDCNIRLDEETELYDAPSRHPSTTAETDQSADAHIQSEFLDRYARVFRGKRQNGNEIYIVYCPLLPRAVKTECHPSKPSFSTSYNLVWTPEQVQELFDITESNVSDHVAPIIRQVMRNVYEAKKRKRMEQN